MKSKQLLLFAVVVLVSIAVSACVRPASTPPSNEATPTSAGGEFPVPGDTQDVMAQLEFLATQTELAKLGGTPGLQDTPLAPAPTGDMLASPAPTEATQPTEVPPTPQPTTERIEVPTATPGRPSSWTLQKGEFPYCIARRYNVNPFDMLSLSGLSAGGTYPSGTVLKVPQSGSFPGNRTLVDHPDSYTVGSGDTIYSIACIYGDADPNAIAYANGLESPYNLTPGQELYIP